MTMFDKQSQAIANAIRPLTTEQIAQVALALRAAVPLAALPTVEAVVLGPTRVEVTTADEIRHIDLPDLCDHEPDGDQMAFDRAASMLVSIGAVAHVRLTPEERVIVGNALARQLADSHSDDITTLLVRFGDDGTGAISQVFVQMHETSAMVTVLDEDAATALPIQAHDRVRALDFAGAVSTNRRQA